MWRSFFTTRLEKVRDACRFDVRPVERRAIA